MFTAVCGFEYHGPKGYIAFSPRITPEDFRAAFTSAKGWGTFAQKRADGKQTEAIDVRWGELTLHTLAFDLPADAAATGVNVMVDGKEIRTTIKQHEHRIVVTAIEPGTPLAFGMWGACYLGSRARP